MKFKKGKINLWRQKSESYLYLELGVILTERRHKETFQRARNVLQYLNLGGNYLEIYTKVHQTSC